VSRSGRFVHLGWNGGEPDVRIVYQDSQGLARIAMGEKGPVFYTGGDDGRVLRHTIGRSGEWESRAIFDGPHSIRGVASGRFTPDPGDECVALFGYSKEVVLLIRKEGRDSFHARTIFVDSDKGHGLTAADLDGRNDTDEIIVCGYSGRVTLLTLSTGKK